MCVKNKKGRPSQGGTVILNLDTFKHYVNKNFTLVITIPFYFNFQPLLAASFASSAACRPRIWHIALQSECF